jgi:hypothetical protein
MSPDDSKNTGRKYPDDGDHILDLFIGIRMHIAS